MTKLAIYATGAVIGLTMLAATVAWFVDVDRDRRELDDLRDNVEATKETRDAQDAIPDDQPSIIDWLLRFSTD